MREFGSAELSNVQIRRKKVQKKEASQQLDLEWSGPGSALDTRRQSAASVLRQRTVRRVVSGRRGEGVTARVALFRDSDGESSSDTVLQMQLRKLRCRR